MIFLILFLGLILRIIGINQSFWLDEAITATIARDLTTTQIINNYLPLDNSPPLFVLLVNFIFGFLPNNEIVDRIPSIIFGLATIFFLYLIAKEWINKKFGLLVALLLATSPLHVYYSHEARMYSLATFLATLLIWSTLGFVKHKKNSYLIWYVIAGMGMLYTHYVAALILLATNAIIFSFKGFTKNWLISQIIIAASFLIWLPIFYKQLVLGVSSRNVSEVFDKVLGKFDIKSIPLAFEKFVLGKIPIENDASLFFIIPPLILFGLLLVNGFLRSENKSKKLLIAWLILPLATAYIISIKIPVFLHYRILFLLPAFYFGIGLGINHLNGNLKKICIILALSINLVSLMIYYTNPNLQREQWRDAVLWVEQNQTAETIVLFASGDPSAPYLWYRKEYPKSVGAFAGFYINPQTDERRVGELIKGKKKVFVFEYLQDITDPQRLLQKWVEDNGFTKASEKSFIGVGEIDVYEN